MSDPIRLARPDVGEAELTAVGEVLRPGMLTMGPKVAEFERALAAACGTAERRRMSPPARLRSISPCWPSASSPATR